MDDQLELEQELQYIKWNVLGICATRLKGEAKISLGWAQLRRRDDIRKIVGKKRVLIVRSRHIWEQMKEAYIQEWPSTTEAEEEEVIGDLQILQPEITNSATNILGNALWRLVMKI